MVVLWRRQYVRHTGLCIPELIVLMCVSIMSVLHTEAMVRAELLLPGLHALELHYKYCLSNLAMLGVVRWMSTGRGMQTACPQ
jgi:hypothetical protein